MHYGHIRVARAAVSDLALDWLIVLPAHVSPFKTDAASKKTRREAPWDRLSLVRVAFAAVPNVVVDEREVRKNGFCPCRLAKSPENFCPCDEFKSQLRDPAFHGLCHCRLYPSR